MQRYLLLNNTANYLTLDFSEPVSRSVQGQLMGAINTNAAGVNDFVVEVDIGAATTPTLQAWVQMRTPDSMTAGFEPKLAPIIRGLIQTTIPVSVTSEIQADVNYGSKGASLLKRLVIYSSILTSFKIKRDSLDVFESIATALNTYIQLDYG